MGTRGDIVQQMSQALLGTWLWLYGEKKNQLWRWIICLTCGKEWRHYKIKVGSNYLSKTENKKNNYGFHLWRSVKAGWERFASYVPYMNEDGCSTVLA